MRGPIISSMRDASTWNVVGSTSTNAGTSPACTIGATSVPKVTAGGDDLVARLEVEHLDRELDRRRAGVDHHAVVLGEQRSATAASHAATFGPRLRLDVRSTSTTASISRSSCTAPGSGSRLLGGSARAPSRCARGVSLRRGSSPLRSGSPPRSTAPRLRGARPAEATAPVRRVGRSRAAPCRRPYPDRIASWGGRTCGSPQREYRSVIQDNLRWQRYVHRPGDIVVCTPPKNGTTWMQTIVTTLLFPGGRSGTRVRGVAVARRTLRADRRRRGTARGTDLPPPRQDPHRRRRHPLVRGQRLHRRGTRRSGRVHVVPEPSRQPAARADAPAAHQRDRRGHPARRRGRWSTADRRHPCVLPLVPRARGSVRAPRRLLGAPRTSPTCCSCTTTT